MTFKPVINFFKYYGGFGQDNQNLRAITDALLWYQDPTRFNDPFDSNPAVQFGDKKTHVHVRAVTKTFGICCFSQSAVNILMWSHYGKNHTGFALEFDLALIKQELIENTEFVNTGLVLLPQSVKYAEKRPDTTMRYELFLSKSEHWKYEKEARIANSLGQGLHPYKRELLRSVIMGSRASEDSIRVMEQTLEYIKFKYGQKIDLHHCNLHDEKFQVFVEGRPDLVDDD